MGCKTFINLEILGKNKWSVYHHHPWHLLAAGHLGDSLVQKPTWTVCRHLGPPAWPVCTPSARSSSLGRNYSHAPHTAPASQHTPRSLGTTRMPGPNRSLGRETQMQLGTRERERERDNVILNIFRSDFWSRRAHFSLERFSTNTALQRGCYWRMAMQTI